MTPMFRASVASLLDFDYDEPKERYQGCIEVVLRNIRGLANLGETVVLVVGDEGPRYTLTLKGMTLGDERPTSLRTGELPLVLQKSAELASTHLRFTPGMTLESVKTHAPE